jgi:hypothetical protein
MGNSTGNVREYWELFRAHRIMQGGFVWDWVDQVPSPSALDSPRSVGELAGGTRCGAKSTARTERSLAFVRG